MPCWRPIALAVAGIATIALCAGSNVFATICIGLPVWGGALVFWLIQGYVEHVRS